jgi:hypothetical protein
MSPERMTLQNEQASGSRVIIECLDREFARLHERATRLVDSLAQDSIYERVVTGSSVGENVLRSAAAVEQTFGGLTSNLWDDPFEWTLPEMLSTPAKLVEYLAEVEHTRRRAFAAITDDTELLRKISLPSEEFQPLVQVLIETLMRAVAYQSRAHECSLEVSHGHNRL